MGHCEGEVALPDVAEADAPPEWSGRIRDIAAADRALWPQACRTCGRAFDEHADAQFRSWDLWQRADGTGELMTHWQRSSTPGAMYFAPWLEEFAGQWKGPDGHVLLVVTPGGDWCIDQRASNCTLPNDHEHRCWVRHGDPPNVTVDKNGKTCGAGAGSIQMGNYHGFLRNGALVDA
jgi:hypothetical protein